MLLLLYDMYLFTLSFFLSLSVNVWYIWIYIYIYVCVRVGVGKSFVTILPGLSFLLKTKILKVIYMNILKMIWATDTIIGRLSFICSLDSKPRKDMDHYIIIAAVLPLLRTTAGPPGFACLRPHV